MDNPISRLPDAELDVMQAVWDCTPPATRADIETHIKGRHPMALTSLLTLLARLTEKGFLSAEKAGRSNCYTALISRQDYLASQSRRFLDRLCGGSIATFANALCDSGLSKDELAQLRALLQEDAL